MIVSNHLSYLDIVAYSALVPCVFVAKKEVASWPVFGALARMAGTIFVDRERRMAVGSANLSIRNALDAGLVVVLFAEGTSSDGHKVLPFRSSHLEPVRRSEIPIVPAAIRYELTEGSISEDVCYWGDMTLLPHLIHLFSLPRIFASVSFGVTDANANETSRKSLAQRLQGTVSQLYRYRSACVGFAKH